MAPTIKVLWDQPDYWEMTDLTWYVDRLDLIELLESKWTSTTTAGVTRQYYQVESDHAGNHRVYASAKLSVTEVKELEKKKKDRQAASNVDPAGYLRYD